MDSKGTVVGTVYGATRVEDWNGQGKLFKKTIDLTNHLGFKSIGVMWL